MAQVIDPTMTTILFTISMCTSTSLLKPAKILLILTQVHLYQKWTGILILIEMKISLHTLTASEELFCKEIPYQAVKLERESKVHSKDLAAKSLKMVQWAQIQIIKEILYTGHQMNVARTQKIKLKNRNSRHLCQCQNAQKALLPEVQTALVSIKPKEQKTLHLAQKSIFFPKPEENQNAPSLSNLQFKSNEISPWLEDARASTAQIHIQKRSIHVNTEGNSPQRLTNYPANLLRFQIEDRDLTNIPLIKQVSMAKLVLRRQNELVKNKYNFEGPEVRPQTTVNKPTFGKKYLSNNFPSGVSTNILIQNTNANMSNCNIEVMTPKQQKFLEKQKIEAQENSIKNVIKSVINEHIDLKNPKTKNVRFIMQKQYNLQFGNHNKSSNKELTHQNSKEEIERENNTSQIVLNKLPQRNRISFVNRSQEGSIHRLTQILQQRIKQPSSHKKSEPTRNIYSVINLSNIADKQQQTQKLEIKPNTTANNFMKRQTQQIPNLNLLNDTQTLLNTTQHNLSPSHQFQLSSLMNARTLPCIERRKYKFQLMGLPQDKTVQRLHPILRNEYYLQQTVLPQLKLQNSFKTSIVRNNSQVASIELDQGILLGIFDEFHFDWITWSLMGLCQSKKSITTKDVISDFTNINTGIPAVVIQGDTPLGVSRFEKVKVHVQQQVDPNAVIDEDIESDDEDEEVVEDDEQFNQHLYLGKKEASNSVLVDYEDDNEEEYYEEEVEEEFEENDEQQQIYLQNNYPKNYQKQQNQLPMDNETAIRQLIQQLTQPNFNLIEQQIQKQTNHDLYATQTTIILNPGQFRRPNDLQKDYEKIPNRLHVPDSMANEHNPNITIPSQPTTSLGLVGLYNLGNTCFINTAIQCLSACQPLADYFISNLHYEEINDQNPMGYKGEVSRAYGKLVKLMWRDNQHTKIYPIRFCKVIEKWAPHEFISYLLDCLHEDLNRAYQNPQINPPLINQPLNVSFDGKNSSVLQQQKQVQTQVNIKKAPKIPEPTNQNDSMVIGQKQRLDEEEAMESWKTYLQKNKSVIVDLFQGQLKSTLQCLVCNFKSTKFDCLMYLSVPIANQKDPSKPIQLQDCLEDFSKQEILDNQNKWYCEQCKKHQPASKKIDIWKLPSILIICLKRFKFMGRNKYLKINDMVSFPMNNLDLSPYVSSPQREKPMYDLFSVANHEGSMTQGHYYAYSWNHASRNWYYFNDQEIKLIKNLQKIQSPEAYILFYSKTSIENFLRQTLRIPDYWPHVVAVAAKTLSSVRGTDKKSKMQRHKIKQQIQSLKSSLSSFAQSGGFMTSKQQNDLMIHFQSQSFLSFNKSTAQNTQAKDVRKRIKKVKKRQNNGQYSNNTLQNSMEPGQNLFLNTSLPSMRHAPSSSTHLNINTININGDIYNQVNNYYTTANSGVYPDVVNQSPRKKKKIVKIKKRNNVANNMDNILNSDTINIQDQSDLQIGKLRNLNKNSEFENNKNTNINDLDQLAKELGVTSTDQKKEDPYQLGVNNIYQSPIKADQTIHLDNESVLDTFGSLNQTANFGSGKRAVSKITDSLPKQKTESQDQQNDSSKRFISNKLANKEQEKMIGTFGR
ncbi:ubiquitin carboxyl-terminal hydrolase family protein [Stylonychia lemnae]|uniref:ubiquitinyl hydrolase 1 n=1 Tax=Stylonychia lemnae TaxID=5949 RepID=A0A078A2G7_STYLE|nr:ubiquitin carboxyl-terminal hydrolase family protein [Stylonychia lemnae]|eukprot:CDW76396.1 ubiquitin carboxyl-terminal hydrolase family protein [Stylonychia lemnae]